VATCPGQVAVAGNGTRCSAFCPCTPSVHPPLPHLRRSSWGPLVLVGTHRTLGVHMFLALAPVGVGSGLVFTELFYRGATHLIRLGSDDVTRPPPEDVTLLKVVDEADGLYGYSRAVGLPEAEWGAVTPASPGTVRPAPRLARPPCVAAP
jgi:hypothetical protein